MGPNGGLSFGEGSGAPPPPPTDIPTPPVSAPDIAGIWAQLARQTIQNALDSKGIPKLFAWIPELVKWVLMSFLSQLLNVMTQFIKLIFSVFSSSDESMNQLAAAAVAGMTGLGSSGSPYPIVRDRENRTAMAQGVATLFTNALKAAAPTGPNGTLAPSAEAANKFMEIAAHMAIEGWLQGWAVELCTWDKAERFADLKDTLEQTLGIGRLSRRAMAPPMKVFVEDPYMALLNKTYHPTRLSPGAAVRNYLGGHINRTELQALMDLDGYPSNYVDQLIADELKLPEPGDIVTLLSHGSMDPTDAEKAMQELGYDKRTGANKLLAIQLERQDGWNRANVQGHMELFKSKHITYSTMVAVLDKANLPGAEHDLLLDLVNSIESSRQTFISKGDAELLYRKGVWDQTRFDAQLRWYDYSGQDVQDLEDLLAHDIDDDRMRALDKAKWAQRREDAFQRAVKARADKLALAQQEVESKGVSTGEYETLVEDGLRSLADFTAYLVRKQVALDNALALTAALQTKIVQKAAAAAKKATAAGKAKAKNLDIAQLESAVKQGLISLAEFITRMEQIGMSPTDAQLLGQELQGQIASAATKAQAVAAAKAKAAQKHLDLSQEERAVRLGIESIAQYSAFLDAHGFEPQDRDVLVSEVQAQLAADKATAAKKAAAAAKLSQKGISLPQLERLVRAGIKTTADYQDALTAAGYDAADVGAMTNYLQLQMQQDQQDLILHGHAAALVGQLGVSLADLERAVKLSVVPIATYQDALNRAGVAAADQQKLVANLAAEIKATRAKQTTLASVSKQVAAAGVTLASLEKDTVTGKLSLPQFETLLAGYGVSQTDITDVAQLVQDEIDNAAATKTLVAQAGARAAAKGLNLAEDTAAYKQGVMTEDEWRARVAALGYDAADGEILFETLAAAQAATAAKSAKKTPASAAPPSTGAAAASAGG